MSILLSPSPQLRSLLCTAMIVCSGLTGRHLTLVRDTERWVAGVIEDYKPSNIQIERMGPNSQESTKRGASLYIGDILSIAKWCKEHAHNEGGSVVIKNTVTGEVRLDCDKDRYYTFTRQMPSSESSSATAPTITVERPGVAATIAVSPTHTPDQSTTVRSPGQSPKIEDLLRKGAEPPSAK